MEIFAFIGPSINQDEANMLLQAKYCSPAKKGSIVNAVNAGAKVILIVDGLFETAPSVWHKEILWGLNEGVAVLGSSSMGALRACETDCYGMYGVGKIYEYYSRGSKPNILKYLTEGNRQKVKASLIPELKDTDAHIDWLCFILFAQAFMHDDDVAISHGPKELGYPAVTDAMVDIFFTVDKSPFCEQTKNSLLLLAKSTYFKKRSYANLATVASHYSFHESHAEIFDWLEAYSFSQKKEDAIDLFKNLDSHLLSINTELIPDFYETRYWKNNFP